MAIFRAVLSSWAAMCRFSLSRLTVRRYRQTDRPSDQPTDRQTNRQMEAFHFGSCVAILLHGRWWVATLFTQLNNKAERKLHISLPEAELTSDILNVFPTILKYTHKLSLEHKNYRVTALHDFFVNQIPCQSILLQLFYNHIVSKSVIKKQKWLVFVQ